MAGKKSPPRKRRGRDDSRSEHRDDHQRQRSSEGEDADCAPLGKGAANLRPLSAEQNRLDYKAGIIMAITFPLAVLFFWKVTLPVTWFVIKTIVGEKLLQKMYFMKEDVIMSMMSECPSWIPAEERAYLNDRFQGSLRRIPSPKTPQEFDALIDQGEPVIITDAMKGWEGFGTWDCDSFIKQYKDAAYFDWQAQKRYKLHNITNRHGYEGLNCAAGYMELFWPANEKYGKEWMKKMSPLPSFLPRNAMADGRPSMTGFIGTVGTGVSPHLDETCDTLMTAQFSGVKNWSLSWPVKEGDFVRWSKPIVFTLYPGDVMLWYANMRHHTEVIHGCSLSFSFNLHTPIPKSYFREQRNLISGLSAEERHRLYEETNTQDKLFLDKCHLVVKDDQVFVH